MRTLGYLFGFLLLLDGIPAIFSPHFWVRYTERNLMGSLPEPVTRTILEFNSLPEDATRAKALGEVLVGMTLLSLASIAAGATYLGSYGGTHKGAPHSHQHSHPLANQQGEMKHAHPHRHDDVIEDAEQPREESL